MEAMQSDNADESIYFIVIECGAGVGARGVVSVIRSALDEVDLRLLANVSDIIWGNEQVDPFSRASGVNGDRLRSWWLSVEGWDGRGREGLSPQHRRLVPLFLFGNVLIEVLFIAVRLHLISSREISKCWNSVTAPITRG